MEYYIIRELRKSGISYLHLHRELTIANGKIKDIRYIVGLSKNKFFEKSANFLISNFNKIAWKGKNQLFWLTKKNLALLVKYRLINSTVSNLDNLRNNTIEHNKYNYLIFLLVFIYCIYCVLLYLLFIYCIYCVLLYCSVDCQGWRLLN